MLVPTLPVTLPYAARRGPYEFPTHAAACWPSMPPVQCRLQTSSAKALISPWRTVGFAEGVLKWTLLESCWFSYAWPVWSLLFFELGHSGSVGPAYLLFPGIGASTYVATRPMIFLACRAPRFSTEEGKFFWQTEMKFAVYETPNSRHGFLKTS